MGYLADVFLQKKVFSHCYNPGKQAKRFTALLQQKGSASASAAQKSRRAEHAAELSADLTLRHLLQSPEIKWNSFPSLVPLGLGIQRLPFASHTQVPCFQVFDTPPLPPSHRQLNNRKQVVHWIKCQHYQNPVSKHNPSHFYQASIQEIMLGDVEPHWVTQLNWPSDSTKAFHPAGCMDIKVPGAHTQF